MVQTVQEQQNRQQKLCRGLKVDIEGLTAAQLDQASRLEDLGQQQETRVIELIHKQDARWLEIEQRQLDVEATMQTLQQDISAVKEVLNTRVNDTESGLQKLRITKQRLTAELQETKTTIMNKMMSELETHFVTKRQLETKMSKTEVTHKLRPGVPEFVPSLSPLTGASGGVTNPGGGLAAAQQFQKSFPFDGRSFGGLLHYG